MSETLMSCAVLFDMDGVLLESQTHNIASFNAVLSTYGLSMDSIVDPHGQGFRGSSLKDMLVEVKQQHGLDLDLDDFAKNASEVAFRLMEEDQVTAEPELVRFLDELADHNVGIALGSASLRWRVERILEILKIEKYFSVIVGADDVAVHKPAPDVYLACAERLDVVPERSVVIEDAITGVEAGKRGGMKVIGFLKYQEQKDSLHAADLIVDDYDELSYEVIRHLVN